MLKYRAKQATAGMHNNRAWLTISKHVKEKGFMSRWQTLNPALLLTVHHYVLHACDAAACALLYRNLLSVIAVVVACALTDMQ